MATGGSAGSAGSGTTGGASGAPDGGTAGDAAVAGCAGIIGHPTQPCDRIPVYPGVKIKLVEDFDTPINLDTDDIWTYSDGFSDQAQARFIKGAITFAGGSAQITMSQPAGGAAPGPTYAEGNSGANGYPAPFTFMSPETSGELRTKYNNFKYGYYEFRMKPPVNTTGNFIAAAFTFRTPKWQDWRELDIELQAAGKSRTVPTNVIVGDNQQAWSMAISDALDLTVNYDTQADFHTYGFDWEPTVVNFYIDRATNPTPVRVYAAGSKLPIPNKSGKIMMNFWLFPSNALGGGDPALNRYPMVMQIDYVHFYKSDQEPFYPCTPTPACLNDATHREDLDFSKNNPTDGLPTTPAGF
jgi:beta-glucanase (GH16 family)